MRVEVHRVSKIYGGIRALDDLSLSLEPGRVVALLGENGAGKSTLLRVLSGLIRPDRGDVLYDGQSLDPSNLPLRRRIMFLPDFPPVFSGESVLRNLGLLLRLYQADGGDAPGRLAQWMEALNLLELSERPIEELSRGQVYKVVLSALLTIDPELWLLDEPLASGMDPRGLAILRREVRSAAARGRTVAFTTQIIEAAARIADDACVIHRGALQRCVPMNQLIRPTASGLHSAGIEDEFLDGLRDP